MQSDLLKDSAVLRSHVAVQLVTCNFDRQEYDINDDKDSDSYRNECPAVCFYLIAALESQSDRNAE